MHLKQSEVELGFWIAEVCLWTPWVYLGDLVADDVSRLAVIDVDEFCAALGGSWHTQNSARNYGHEFLEAMKKQETWSDTWQQATWQVKCPTVVCSKQFAV